jgi:hypothetical protein
MITAEKKMRKKEKNTWTHNKSIMAVPFIESTHMLKEEF